MWGRNNYFQSNKERILELTEIPFFFLSMLFKIILGFLPLSVAQENNLHNYCMFINACTCAWYQVLFKTHLKYSYPQMSDSYVELTSCCKSWPSYPSEGGLMTPRAQPEQRKCSRLSAGKASGSSRGHRESQPQRGRAGWEAAAELPAAHLRAEYRYVCTCLPDCWPPFPHPPMLELP